MKTKSIAEGGICVALTIMLLYLHSIMPISRLAFITIASCIIPICVIRLSVKSAFIIFVASSLLSSFIMPIQTTIYYTFLFGPYGLLKYFIEKSSNRFIEIILKLISLNVLSSFVFFLILKITGINLLKENLYFILFFIQIVFLVYDYALTLIISIYYKKIHKKI